MTHALKVLSLMAGVQLMQAGIAADWARGQGMAVEIASYCLDLKRVAALALTSEKFASIAGKVRQGNFLDTTLPLTGWSDCSLYGAGTYTCDSRGLTGPREAEQAQSETLREIAACFGDSWTEAHDRSSANYDRTDKDEHVVRLILFVRRN